jgi:hypothetical protein
VQVLVLRVFNFSAIRASKMDSKFLLSRLHPRSLERYCTEKHLCGNAQPIDATPSSALIRQCFRGRTVRLAVLGQNLARAESLLV